MSLKGRVCALCDLCGKETNVLPCFSTSVLCEECEEKVARGEVAEPSRNIPVRWKYRDGTSDFYLSGKDTA